MRKKVLFGMLCGLMLLLSGCGKTKDVQNNQGQTSENSKTAADDQADVQENEHVIDAIKQRGYLIVGCKTDVPGLGFYDNDTKEWSGLEVELAYQTAANIFAVNVHEAKKQERVQFKGVTVADREEKLQNGEIDCLFATYTMTHDRKERFAFSDSYYTDYIGLMVKADYEDPNALGKQGIRSIADLDGKYIGVAKNATTRAAFINYMETMNTIKTSPIFMEYESYEGLFRALKKGEIDVMAVDVSILNGYADASTKILSDRFGGQPYGAAVLKENRLLLDAVNAAIADTSYVTAALSHLQRGDI